MAAFYAFPGLVYRPIVDMSPLPLGLIWVTAHENGRIRAFADAGRRQAEMRGAESGAELAVA
jgi:hypothetical protein